MGEREGLLTILVLSNVKYTQFVYLLQDWLKMVYKERPYGRSV